jgi:hypothetical protein
MNAYRFVAWPRGRQPTRDEAALLRLHGAAVEGRFAWGHDRRDQRLLLAFDAALFDAARQRDATFDALIAQWELCGCQVLAEADFIKDASALRPVATAPGGRRPGSSIAAAAPVVPGGAAPPLAPQELVARESLGKFRLQIQRAKARYAAWQRAASWLPWLWMGAAAIFVTGWGLWIGQRLLNARVERHRETIERIARDPLREDLRRKAAAQPGAPPIEPPQAAEIVADDSVPKERDVQ